MYVKQRAGSVEVICGPMFSGKTDELHRRLRRVEVARQTCQVFQPAVERQLEVGHTTLRAAIEVRDSLQLRSLLDPEVAVVAVDQVHLLDEGIVVLAEAMADRGIRVILAGMDLDSRGEPYPVMAALLARAEFVLKLQAICVVCGAAASRTQRRFVRGGGVPLGLADPYEARCRHCHDLPVSDGVALFEDVTLQG